MKMPPCHLSIHLSFPRTNWFSRTIRIFYLNPEEKLGCTSWCWRYSEPTMKQRTSYNDSAYPVLCHRGTQTFPTCSRSGGWGWLLSGLAASGWQTAHLHLWGSWGWWRTCAGPHRTMSACSWTSGHRTQRWHKLPWKTVNRLRKTNKGVKIWNIMNTIKLSKYIWGKPSNHSWNYSVWCSRRSELMR